MTPAYSAHLNADTAALIIRQTFQTFEYQYSRWFVAQPLKQNSLMQTLILRRLNNAYNVYQYRCASVVSVHLQYYFKTQTSLSTSQIWKRRLYEKLIEMKIYLQMLKHAF